MPFRDRTEAGKRLSRALAGYRDEHPVIFALPRGGIPIAAIVADDLNATLDLVLVRKIGVPFQPELAMGAVVDGPQPVVVRNEEVIRLAGISESTFERAKEDALSEIARRRKAYLGSSHHPDIAGRTAIIIDDGIATGATIRAALRALRDRRPATIVLAVPVAAADTIASLATEADDIVCLEQPDPFFAIGAHYADFRQLRDEDVTATMQKLQDRSGSSA